MEEKTNNLWEYRSLIIDKYKNCVYLSKLHEKSYELFDVRYRYFRIFEIISLSITSISLMIYLVNDSRLMLILAMIMSVVTIGMVFYIKDYLDHLKFSLHKQAIDIFNGLADQYKRLFLDLENGNIDHAYLRESLDYLNSEFYDCNSKTPRPNNYKEEMNKLKENMFIDIDNNRKNDDEIIPKELRR